VASLKSHGFIVSQVGDALGVVDVGHDDGVWELFQIGWHVCLFGLSIWMISNNYDQQNWFRGG
jgi:hypothetical protein